MTGDTADVSRSSGRASATRERYEASMVLESLCNLGHAALRMRNYILRKPGCNSRNSSRPGSLLLVLEYRRELYSRNLSFCVCYVLSQSTDDRLLVLGSHTSICHLRRGALDTRTHLGFGDVADFLARLDHIAEALRACVDSAEDLCMHTLPQFRQDRMMCT